MNPAPNRVSTGYVPHQHQAELHAQMRRFNVLVCHRRFGKTVLCVNTLIDAAARGSKGAARYAYVAPLLKQAKEVSWDYFKRYAGALPGVTFNESELRVDFPNGSRIKILGSDNPDALRGMYLDGIVMDEVAQMPRKLWGQVVRPALSDRKGWAIFIGTPMGHNQFFDFYQRGLQDTSGEWLSRMFRAGETGLIDQNELYSARRDMTDEEYDQEFECSFTAAIQGAYYGKLLAQADQDKRVSRVPHDPAVRVDTHWDLGVSDYTSIWFSQAVGREVRLIDFYQASGVGLDHYAGVLDKRGYLYGDHWAPHDIRVRELSTAKSRLAIAADLGIRFRIVPSLNVMDGINAARLLLPRCWFDAEKCREGLEALRQYRSDYDERLRTLKPVPLHDWTSHAADSFRYLAVAWQDAALRELSGGGMRNAHMTYDVLSGPQAGQACIEHNPYG